MPNKDVTKDAIMLTKETKKYLAKVGVYTHTDGFGYDPIVSMCQKMPFCAIWHESEEPTKEEIAILSQLPQYMSKKWGSRDINWDSKPTDNKYCDIGANMVTLKKENGLWTYRRATWEVGPRWYPKSDTLKEIVKEAMKFDVEAVAKIA